MKYSLIIPVFNRPEEVEELLQSLTWQTFTDMEVVVVEDGSSIPCEDVVKRYAGKLDVKYFKKPNSGPGPSRNYGAAHSQGEFLIILDSDVVVPPGYLAAVEDELKQSPCDAFGGPDRAHESFTPMQKAINYSMTSFFTTGGIRGGRKQMDRKFYPRSFNMGIRAGLYHQLGGFSPMRFGEDIDLSLRIYESGARCRLFPEAWVWHKRRTDLKKFFKQVHNSGIARINLMKRHPGSLKPVHLLPALFTVATFALLALTAASLAVAAIGGLSLAAMEKPGCATGPVCTTFAGILGASVSLAPLAAFCLLILTDSSLRNRSLHIGALSVKASFIQLIGYGTGFLRAWWLRCVRGRDEELQAFRHTFYQ